MNLRHDFEAIRNAALSAVDPFAAVKRALSQRVGIFCDDPDGMKCGLATGRLILVAVGKAAMPMAAAAFDRLGELIDEGLVVTKHGHLLGYELPSSCQVIEAGHPVPDPAGLEAGRRLIDLLESTAEHDLVLVLLSGGASALLPAPVRGVSLDDLQATTDLLLRSGATIVEINAVRKHLSSLKGGQLARLAAPARIVSLILSDVVGDPLDVIASGPTVADPTSFADALKVLAQRQVADRMPPAVTDCLHSGAAGERDETPKPGDGLFDRVTNLIVGSNRLAATAAVNAATDYGYHSLLLTTFLEGQAREIAKVIVALARGIRAHGDPISPPACLVLGGETTVTVRGEGKGGRNQELALAAALGLEGMEGVGLMALATDGTDGPTDGAGAVVDGQTVRKAAARGWDVVAALRDNNAYPVLADTGDLLRLGPTGTNVNDLLVLLVT